MNNQNQFQNNDANKSQQQLLMQQLMAQQQQQQLGGRPGMIGGISGIQGIP